MAGLSRNWRLAAASAVLVLLVTAVSVLTFPGRSGAQVPETFTVISALEKSRFVAPPKPNRGRVGGYDVLRQVLMDESLSAVVGAEVDHCLYVFNGRQLCNSAFNINGRGRLIAEGIWSAGPGGANTFAVTGGTGDFSGAEGTARFESFGDGHTEITFDLIP